MQHSIPPLRVSSVNESQVEMPLADQIAQQSCSGISFKTQALYFLVYLTRYLGPCSPFQLHSPPLSLTLIANDHRSLLDFHRLGLEHRFQAHLSRLVRLHVVRHAE